MKRVVIITGASGGIGRAVSNLFQSRCDIMNTAIIWVDRPLASPVGLACNHKFVPLDVTDKFSFAQGIKNVLSWYVNRGLVLINAAGVLPPPSPFVKTSEETIEKILAVNLRGTMNCCKAVLPIMREQGYGRIVNVSSTAAQSGDPGNTAYAVSKAAVEKLTKQLAIEAPFNKDGEPFDITVNAVAPGIVDTPMTAGLSEKALEKYFERSPLKRKIKPEEVAEAVYFLATVSAAINGIILPVDGGYLAS